MHWGGFSRISTVIARRSAGHPDDIARIFGKKYHCIFDIGA
jgi:hypothetical protein